jgi:hypothetical protein|nr:MAG TPA: GDSL-like Lipase/Acylhydrolase family protein/Beta fold, peptidoglycan hydrolase, HYDROLASE [Caudoviricetes sp.]
MSNYANLKAAIAEVIKTNGNNEITGAIMQSTLLSVVNALSQGAIFAGIATPTTNPGTPDGNVFYIAGQQGTYANFNSTIVGAKVVIFYNNASNVWVSIPVAVPTFDVIKAIHGNALTINGYIYINGGVITSSTRKVTDYLDISNMDTVFLNSWGSEGTAINYAFYDANKTFISGVGNNAINNQDIVIQKTDFPTGTKYLRMTGDGVVNSTCYVIAFTVMGMKAYTDTLVAQTVSQIYTALATKVDVNPGNNLANRSLFVDGGMVRSDGSITTNSTPGAYAVTGFIPVKENTSISINHDPSNVNGYFALYDENKNPIAGTVTKNRTLPYVAGAKYAVFSVLWSWTDIMVNYGDTALAYEAYNPIAGYPGNPPADGAVTTAKIADGAVTTAKIAGRTIFVNNTSANLYATSYSELWIDPQFRDTTTEGLKYYTKITGNYVYFRPYINGATPYVWNAVAALPNPSTYHNTPIALICNVAGGGVVVGDVVGYVVFIDTEIWTTSDMGLGQIVTDYIFDIGRFPTIYAYTKNPNITTMEAGIEVVLPTEIVVTVGDNLEVFYRPSIRCINPYSYDIVSICSVGKNYPRYFQFKPEAVHAGNTYTLRIDVKRNDTTVIATKTTTIRVIPSISAPATQKNILVFGASATANGNFTYECQRRLTTNTGDGTPYNPTGLNLGNIAFVGRKTGTAKNVKLEATGGWSWADFAGPGPTAYRFNVTGVTLLNIGNTYSVNGVVLTVTEVNVTDGIGNIRCTYEGSNTVPASGTLTRVTGSGDATITYTSVESETYNPFWNDSTGKLDFINYANLYCNGAIDVLISHCGVNDIFIGRTGQTLVDTYVKPFARAFHTDFPNSKFIISSLPIPDCTGGMGANYGATLSNYYNRSQGFWDTAKAFDAMANDAEFSGWVTIAPVLQLFDNENGYPKLATPVNNRSTVTELLGTNGAHPTEYGSYMVADAIYRVINKILV